MFYRSNIVTSENRTLALINRNLKTPGIICDVVHKHFFLLISSSVPKGC
jgi:hypothetical protein